ncbi:MAG: tetratricopeptide repeat protein [Acetobacteraceae bacterium]|nr:tetratricopeptide repeat protein [Acetobacteraceae bacterium]
MAGPSCSLLNRPPEHTTFAETVRAPLETNGKDWKLPARSEDGSPGDRAQWTFGRLLGWHLTRGTRPGGSLDRPGRKWSAPRFAGAIGVNDRTVRNWLNDANLPADTDTIERVLFANIETALNDPYTEWRLELRSAHAGISGVPLPKDEPQDPPPGGKPANLPYPSLGPLFKGRETFLRGLRASLLRDNSAVAAIVSNAIHGMGGIGKTRAAVEYAWAHRDDYTALLFVNADSPQNLETSFAALTGPLRLPEHTASDDSLKRHATLAWLRGHPGWLLILDNVDSEAARDAASAMLGGLTGGHVVLTSRLDRGAWHGITPLDLDVLALDAAAAFLLEATDGIRVPHDDDNTRARELAMELGQLALALDLAVATIRQGRSFAQYRTLWRDAREKVRGWNQQTITGYHHAVGETWQTSVALVSPEARILLERLAFLAPDPVPGFLLDVAVPGAPQAAVGAAAEDAREAMLELARYSLVKRDTQADRFTIHRLIQDATRRGLDPAIALQRLTDSLGWLNAGFEGDPGDVRSWPRLDPLAVHAETLAWAADKSGIVEPTGRLMNSLGQLFHAKARFVHAELLTKRVLAITETNLGRDHPTVATCLNNLAALLRATNRLAEAEPLFRRALAIDEASFGPDHPDVAIDLNNLAELLSDTNRLADAEPLYRRALAIAEASFGPDHPDVARSLNNLAELLRATNRLAEAEPLYRRALAIDEASFGPDHPDVAIDLNNLALLLCDTNRLAEAEPLYRRALAIDEASFGPDHPSVAIRLNNLAGLLSDTNRLADAEPLYRRALAIDEASFGPDHPHVAIDLNNLAGLLRATNRLADAEPLCRRALAIGEASLGPDHPNMATRLNNLAELLRATNRLAEAEPLYRRALAIGEASLGPDHPNVAAGLNNLALLLRATNRLAEAEPLMRRMVVIFLRFQRDTGHVHPHRDGAIGNYSVLLADLGRDAAAISAAIADARREAGPG